MHTNSCTGPKLNENTSGGSTDDDSACHPYYKKDHSCYGNLLPRLIPFWNLCTTRQCKGEVRVADGCLDLPPQIAGKWCPQQWPSFQFPSDWENSITSRMQDCAATPVWPGFNRSIEGFCFSISKREFVPNAIPALKIGKVSPRAFVKCDTTSGCSTPPRGVQHHLDLDTLKKPS